VGGLGSLDHMADAAQTTHPEHLRRANPEMGNRTCYYNKAHRIRFAQCVHL